jgi:hypothetical protein
MPVGRFDHPFVLAELLKAYIAVERCELESVPRKAFDAETAFAVSEPDDAARGTEVPALAAASPAEADGVRTTSRPTASPTTTSTNAGISNLRNTDLLSVSDPRHPTARCSGQRGSSLRERWGARREIARAGRCSPAEE